MRPPKRSRRRRKKHRNLFHFFFFFFLLFSRTAKGFALRAERRDEMVSKQASFHARMVLNRGSDIQTFFFFSIFGERERKKPIARA
jgi:hypothetical protein